ncbi:hypothetical protein [Dietzia timorensis]|uniref:Uncharacterized protein n=1 Tax=Dietzia timorensis TaxID=499555 RepID=A0A173LK86_9ACTN|nr:hypothetical protein [Dietzia timorensis]ANI90990.1 Hypothetical protein BJL86_0179 [Dietzia timorensis]
MRKFRGALVAAATVGLAMSAGMGVASAEDAGQDEGTQPVPCAFESGDKVDSRPECRAQVFGYGSFGTESLANVLSSAINTGSVVLSIDVPDVLSLNGVMHTLGSQQGGPLFSVGDIAFGSLSDSLNGS